MLRDVEYGDKRMFALLSLLFPFVDLRNQFHVDHVFPISGFTSARLRSADSLTTPSTPSRGTPTNSRICSC